MTVLGSRYPLNFVRINATSDGDNTVVTGTTGKSIVVINYVINVNAAGVVQFQDSAGSAVVFASYEFPDSGGASFVGTELSPAFRVTKGLNLEINCAAGVDALGHLCYVLTE
jgi:hypothetical protein